MPYTARDDPTAVARIERDLRHITDTVRTQDPGARAIVLTGGFARGEGAVRDGRPQNDYDLIVVRSGRRPKRSYTTMREGLETDIDLHLDLAPIPLWRLPLASPSVFWYETALRGRTLWGDDLLDRIPIRDPRMIPPAEGLRLLVNRSAGLLLAKREEDPHAVRVQAAKGLLAAMDACMLANGLFAPSQTERWHMFQDAVQAERLPGRARDRLDWYRWAFAYKTMPDEAAAADPTQAWDAAAHAILDELPSALNAAGHRDLDSYGRCDTVADHVYWLVQASRDRTARRFVRHPTGRVRVATLRMLETALAGRDENEATRTLLSCMSDRRDDPILDLERLRQATLQ